MNHLDDTLAALADPVRRHIVDLLRHGPCCAGELATQVETTAPAMSRHLRILRDGGLVEVERVEDDARLRRYHLKREPLRALEQWVGWVQEGGDQPAAPKAHADKRRRPRKA